MDGWVEEQPYLQGRTCPCFCPGTLWVGTLSGSRLREGTCKICEVPACPWGWASSPLYVRQTQLAAALHNGTGISALLVLWGFKPQGYGCGVQSILLGTSQQQTLFPTLSYLLNMQSQLSKVQWSGLVNIRAWLVSFLAASRQEPGWRNRRGSESTQRSKALAAFLLSLGRI